LQQQDQQISKISRISKISKISRLGDAEEGAAEQPQKGEGKVARGV